MNLTNLTTKTELKAFLQGIYQPHVTALQGIMDKLPEALRPDFLKLKNDLNAQLEKLGPLDQVPAALDAGYAMQGLSSAIERIQDYALAMAQRLADLSNKFAVQTSAMQELNGKVTSGELITKAAATELCGAARKDALDSMKPTILAMRKQQVELAGLPLPADELLGSDEPVFTPRFEAAKKNVEALGKRGLKVGGKGSAVIKDLAWLSAEEFGGKLTSYEDILGKERPAGDPLLGSGAGAGDAGAGAKPDGKNLLLGMA